MTHWMALLSPPNPRHHKVLLCMLNWIITKVEPHDLSQDSTQPKSKIDVHVHQNTTWHNSGAQLEQTQQMLILSRKKPSPVNDKCKPWCERRKTIIKSLYIHYKVCFYIFQWITIVAGPIIRSLEPLWILGCKNSPSSLQVSALATGRKPDTCIYFWTYIYFRGYLSKTNMFLCHQFVVKNKMWIKVLTGAIGITNSTLWHHGRKKSGGNAVRDQTLEESGQKY